MDKSIYLEIFGYIGTALVIISMMMTSVNKLRIFNISGSIISTIYSIICDAWPIVVMNICLIVINVTQLIRSFYHKIHFEFIKENYTNPIFKLFINKYSNELNTVYQTNNINDNHRIYMIYNGCEPIALIILNNENFVELIYATKQYRNNSFKNYLLSEMKKINVNILLNCSLPFSIYSNKNIERKIIKK